MMKEKLSQFPSLAGEMRWNRVDAIQAKALRSGVLEGIHADSGLSRLSPAGTSLRAATAQRSVIGWILF
jgi:hypothetical protein